MAPPKDNAFYEAASFSTSNKTHQLITCRWESLAVLWASDLATEISISLTESGIVGWITVSWKIWNRKWDTNHEPRQLNTLWSTSMLGCLIWPAININLSLANSQWAGQKWNLASVLTSGSTFESRWSWMMFKKYWDFRIFGDRQNENYHCFKNSVWLLENSLTNLTI